MTAGRKIGTQAMTEKGRKDDVLSSRDKAQRPASQSLDGKRIQVEEDKDIPTNQQQKPTDNDDNGAKAGSSKEVDRPGFDLGGSTGKTPAGKGLGLGEDAMEGRKGWGLPRRKK